MIEPNPNGNCKRVDKQSIRLPTNHGLPLSQCAYESYSTIMSHGLCMSHIFCEKVDIHDTDHLFRINIHDIMTHLMTHYQMMMSHTGRT